MAKGKVKRTAYNMYGNKVELRKGEFQRKEDGKFVYYCGCGNPVNDSDLCEGYTYDDAAKTITLNCIETTDEMVTTIKIVKCDENSLHLDFNGETRIFEK